MSGDSFVCDTQSLVGGPRSASATRPAGEHIGVHFNKWWLLPFGILTTSTMLALSILVFGPTLADRSSDDEVAQHGGHGPTETSGLIPECSGALAADHACYQQRYGSLVRVSGVEAAFAQLKDEFTKDEFVNSNCHHLTHIIGRAAAELYGDAGGQRGTGRSR